MALVRVDAQTLPKLFVNPATYHASQLGEVFTININVANVTNLKTCNFTLGYNPTLLHAVNVALGPFLLPAIMPLKQINNSAGYIRASIASFWSSGVSGNGTVARITFNATYFGSGSCALHLYNTELIDKNGNPISHNVQDGNYQFVILGITAATDKYSYLPGQNVTISGNLTLGGLPQQGLVGLEVDNPTGQTVVRTLKTGVAPPPGNITIAEVYPSDAYGNPQKNFTTGANVYFTINVTNTGTALKNVIVTFNAYDNKMVPLGAVYSQFPVAGLTSVSLGLGIPISSWANFGNATGYVSAFTDFPRDGGIPYCPEMSATFLIVGGSGGPPTQQVQGYGNYSLTFKLPPGPTGIYQVYATSSYKSQSVMVSKVFGVGVICVPSSYSTIQAAVNAATPTNNSILVFPGTYNEHVIINKTIQLIGVNPSNTIINGTGTGTVVKVTAANVEISRFTIRNGGASSPNSGIALTNSTGSTISENTILNNYYGIMVNSSNNNNIRDNTLSNNNHGIYLNQSTGTTLRNNNMTGNKYNFGVFGNSLSHFIQDIDTSNTVNGKPIIYWINMTGATIPSNAGFIAIVNSEEIAVRGLSLTKEGQGLLLAFTNDSLIERVNVTNNEYGLYLVNSDGNTIVANNVANNTVGIYQSYCNENFIYHNNFINNTNQFYIYQSSNTWNDPADRGNYWSDYKARYPSAVEIDSSGIWNTPYVINANNTDWYPLVAIYVLRHYIHITNVTFVLPCKAFQLYPGWVINVTATARNEGDFTESFNVTAYYNGTAFGTKTVTELIPWAETAIQFAWDTQGVPPGKYTISAQASVVPGETVADRTCIGGNVTLLVPTLNDVAITSVKFLPPLNITEAYAHWVIDVAVTLENIGQFRDIFNLTVYYGVNVGVSTMVTLYPLQNETVNVVWNTANVSPGNYTITANATIPGVANPASNEEVYGPVEFRLWGDVNGDGIVNVTDMLALKIDITLGVTAKEKPFDDVNGDGVVNVTDMLTLKIILTTGV
jgi:parallel beta-helix repeat protein